MKNVETKAVKDFDGYVGNQLMTFAKGDDLNLGFGQHKILKHAGRVGLVSKYGAEESSGGGIPLDTTMTIGNLGNYTNGYSDGSSIEAFGSIEDGYIAEIDSTVQSLITNFLDKTTFVFASRALVSATWTFQLGEITFEIPVSPETQDDPAGGIIFTTEVSTYIHENNGNTVPFKILSLG